MSRTVLLVLLIILAAVAAYGGLDYPHSSINSIGCSNCHYVYGGEPTLMPPWLVYGQQGVDDTQYNALCWYCHTESGTAAYLKTHSSATTDNSYGDWTIECRTCHNPHQQKQFWTYGSQSYIYSGVSTTIQINQPVAGKSQLTGIGAGWGANAYSGMLVLPNVSQGSYGYKIESNTADTLTVKGVIDLTKVAPGVSTFAIIYGKLLKSTITLDEIIDPMAPKTGDRTVRFFNPTGTNSFADGDLTYDSICEICHTLTNHFRNDGQGTDPLHLNMGNPAGTNCTLCHKHMTGFPGMGAGAHPTHVTNGYGPQLICSDCHGSNTPPMLADGQNLASTMVCSNCHSSESVATARSYWGNPGSSEGAADTWGIVEGELSFCGSCHDATPGNTKGDGTGDTAPNVMGNGTTYGYSITGHGKTSGNFARLSWQDFAATGNPAANRQCSACHDLTAQHFNNTAKRLKTGYENDNNNSNCKQCHDPGTVATGDPQWYTTYTAYEGSAHKVIGNLKCTNCHDVHGAKGSYKGMTTADRQNLCLQSGCHPGQSGHSIGSAFNKSSKTYSVECISCHNVHIVTGKFTADSTKSPLTKLSDNLNVWGDGSGEKMNDFAGSGSYRTPSGDTLSGSQLPNYPSFCLDCHGQNMSPGSIHGNISWGDMHGTAASNSPNGGGVCPNWYVCGKAENWDGDDCIAADKNDCWPVISRGKGDELFSRQPYNHEERIANINFVMSCNDCHVTHVSGSGKMRSTINGSSVTMSNWQTVCNACHYYSSDWHAGMSCGAANSCHDSNPNYRLGVPSESIHGMPNGGSGGAARTFNPDLVLDYRFEGNNNDSGSWRMHGQWFSTAGSYATGKVGQAAVFEEDVGVQVGTRNSSWSADEGEHGTWKYTEMKFNTTLEAWVYPTDDVKSDYTIFIKHVGVGNNGSYSFDLQKINGALRAAFNMAADNNGVSQDGRAGMRGAYSSVAVPLNKWTHVAVTFDTSGPDRDPNDPGVGRIRIYVNGENVTTSDSSGNNMQPGVNETSIYAFSENNGWNQVGVCAGDSWCASEFAIGGFDWQTTNFIGRIDEAKVWNVTKDASYFASYDSQAGPYISEVKGLIGNSQITVRFSEGVYGAGGSSLDASDFTLTDTNGDNPRTITGVTHTAGSSTAVITMSAPLTVADIDADTVAAASNAIYDNYNLAAGTETVTIGMSSQCPTSPVSIQLNEPSGNSYILDTQNVLYGEVFGGASTLTGSEYSGGGDGSGRYIMFDYNSSCLQATTAMTIETRIKPTGIPNDTTTSYVRRIIARDGGGNFQLSVWRNNDWNPGVYTAPPGEASIALWTSPVDNHSGNAWKPVLTNYTGAANGSENNCPIISDHWYQVKAVWNTNKPGGNPGSFFQPADIYIDDQGTDGLGAGENWSGYINCTDSDQSLKADIVKFYTGDIISTADSAFAIGANRNNPANNLFNGLIDWIMWKDSAD